MAYTNGASKVVLGTSSNRTQSLRICLNSMKGVPKEYLYSSRRACFAQPFKEQMRQENKKSFQNSLYTYLKYLHVSRE